MRARTRGLGAEHSSEEGRMDILTVEEAARLIRINRKSLYERIQVNRPPWAQHFGRCIRIYPSESDPEAWSPDRFRGV